MSAIMNPAFPVPGRRLTPRQSADVLGLTVNQVVFISATGGRYFDPSFPPMHRGTFDEAGILAWKKVRDDRANASISPTGAPASPPRDRRTTPDRTAK
jgi:hypothetical protein